MSNKKGLHSRKSTVFVFIALALFSIVIMTDIRFEYLGLTGFAVKIFSQNTANIEVYTSQPVGVIRDDFYGANTHGSWLGEGTKIDTNGDGVKESDSDLAWHRQAWLDSGMKMMRWDAGLQGIYEGPLTNLDFEDWSDLSTKFIDLDSETGADGWKVSSYNDGEGYVGATTDSYRGNYALNITTISGDHLYVYRKLDLYSGRSYNLSAFVKGNGSFSIAFQRLDNYSNCGYKSFNLNGSGWTRVSIDCNAQNSDDVAFRFVIDSIDPNERLLIDDIEITENGAPYRPDFVFTGDLSSRIEQLEWAHQNDIKTMVIASYMPSWLADTSLGVCNLSKITDCPPSNYTLWGEIVMDYMDRLTQNGLYSDDVKVEVWNEPYGDSFLSTLSYDNILKPGYYNLLFDGVVDQNIEYSIGGPSGYHVAPNMINGFLAGDNNFDFITVHPYLSNYETNNGLYNKTKWIFDLCSTYQQNCNYIINSEWNVGNNLTKSSNLSRYKANIALGYKEILNNYPANVSMILYQWSEDEKYSATQYYNEYPQKWNMVSEPGLDNEYTPAYNVTKNFAHYHAGGDTVVTSVSDNSNVRVVSSMKPNGTIYVTLISINSVNTTTTISFDSNVYGLRNIETGEIYIANNGAISVGTLSQYDVKYFVQIPAPVVNDTTPPVITIVTPQALEYSSSNIGIFVQLNEAGTCTYSLDNGITNKSLSTTNNLNFAATEIISLNGDYTMDVNCYDSSYNLANKEIAFSVLVPGNSDLSVSSSGGGGGGGGGGGTNFSAQNVDSNLTTGPNDEVLDSSSDSTGEDSVSGSAVAGDPSLTLNESDEKSASSRGILGRVIDNVKNTTGKGMGYVIFILIVIGALLFCIVLVTDIVNTAIANKKKYGAVKDWVKDNHTRGYEHDHLKSVLLNNGWSEKLVDKAIDEHKDQLEDDKYKVPFGG